MRSMDEMIQKLEADGCNTAVIKYHYANFLKLNIKNRRSMSETNYTKFCHEEDESYEFLNGFLWALSTVRMIEDADRDNITAELMDRMYGGKEPEDEE